MCGTKKRRIFISHPPPLSSRVGRKIWPKQGLEPGATLRNVPVTPSSLGSSTLWNKSWGSSMLSIEWSSWSSPIRYYGLEESEKRSGKQVALAIGKLAFQSTALGAPEPGHWSKPPSERTIQSPCGGASGQSRWEAWLQTNKQIDKRDPNIHKIQSYKLQNRRLTSTTTFVTIYFSCSLQKQAQPQALKEH